MKTVLLILGGGVLGGVVTFLGIWWYFVKETNW